MVSEYCMSRALLLRLLSEGDSRNSDTATNLVRLMADHGNDLFGSRHVQRCPNNVVQQRVSSDFV